MGEPTPPKSSGPFGRMDQLYYHIGKGLVAWQEVEDAHFRLFFQLLGAPNYELTAVVYYSVENFILRNSMIDKLARLSFVGRNRKKQRRVWCDEKGGLCKEIVQANKTRNKLAHYDAEITHDRTEYTEHGIRIVVAGPRLRPSAYNVVSHLTGENAPDPEFNLSVDDVRECAGKFKQLAKKIDTFRKSIPVPPEAGLGQSLGPPPKYLIRHDRARQRNRGQDDEPHEE
jgi:hypothetical protein